MRSWYVLVRRSRHKFPPVPTLVFSNLFTAERVFTTDLTTAGCGTTMRGTMRHGGTALGTSNEPRKELHGFNVALRGLGEALKQQS